MAKEHLPQSGLPIRKTKDLLPGVFQTPQNNKFLGGVLDPLVQPGVLQKLSGYIGKRYGKTYQGKDVYLDNDNTLRSRYQLEPGVVYTENETITNFYDYLDLKNQLKFFGNNVERDDQTTGQKHYSWNPPIDWDKFINFREYYWAPLGPPSLPVYGQAVTVVSTYTVTLGVNSFIFTPDGYTNNPTIKLYRGQTYNFKVNAPKEGFIIRTNYDTGSLLFDSILPYSKGQIMVYDDQFWKALVDIPAGSNPSQIFKGSEFWEFVDSTKTSSALDYRVGVTNNGTQNGTVTFTVAYDAPDILFYQSVVDPNKFGKFVIANIDENTKIDVEKEIVGKINYTSSNGIKFSNCLVVEFRGGVLPEKYAHDTWLVDGVGSAITLTRFSDLVPPVLSKVAPEVLFDDAGFDTDPYDDAGTYPAEKDYITINRNSQDLNPWSRYNRWFHRSILDYSYGLRGQDFPATESLRATRPIIEYNSNLQLFQHGAVAKISVDYIDTNTTDVFSNIEGSIGYSVDGEFLFEGARVLITADTDSQANNRIYQVKFITFNNPATGGTTKQITLIPTDDSESKIDQCVLIKRGMENSGFMYYFNGYSWVKSQIKSSVNQHPMFDVYDSDGVSFSNTDSYPISTFTGSTILEYKVGNGVADSQLGFSLSYLNIDNIGDIQFNWTFGSDKFYYKNGTSLLPINISTGFYKLNLKNEYLNGWATTNIDYIQPIVDSIIIKDATNVVTLTTVNWLVVTPSTKLIINFYLNGKRMINNLYTRHYGTFTFTHGFAANDVVSIKIITDLEPLTGYYEIPAGLEKNPLNQELINFTYGEAVDHISTATEFDDRLDGIIPGVSNLRDISGYQPYATRFLKHASLAPISISLLCDKENNVIKSLQYAKAAYTEFKNLFLARALEIGYNENLNDFVDDIINDISKTKTSNSPFSDSDMLGTGAFTAINYTVEDTGIVTFALSQPFSLKTLSKKAVYVYINNNQLLNTIDYEFNSTFGFVIINRQLAEGDMVEIREYVSTTHNNVPPTPTSLGLYKKYTPKIFIDDTYRTPQRVIQGHDGSITVAYDDFRDDLLLELEYRIYNNIKQEYDTSVFDIDSVIGGYYGNSLYGKSQLDEIVEPEFLKWIQNTNINYLYNSYFIEYEPFTYTYSNMTDPTGTKNLPGWWRGIYQWFYDTDRPHRCPWEMLGFSEEPIWWLSVYGPAPYTKNNLMLWEDLENGIIRQGVRAGTFDRYKRPGMSEYLPVDEEGKLVNPLDSGLAQNFTLFKDHGSFYLGDVAPVEYAWRSSSEWPFAVTMAMCLLKPFEFISDNFDKSKLTLNKIGQLVNSNSGIFTQLQDIIVPTSVTDLSSGLIDYIIAHAKSDGRSLSMLQDKLSGIDVRLSSRLSGFVDKTQQQYLLDSKNPKSTSGSVYVPLENYDVIFNVGSTFNTIAYSGVILEKTDQGWMLAGYDNIHPYFNYYAVIPAQNDWVISVGGVSAPFVEWEINKAFTNGQFCSYRNDYYRCLKSHTSQSGFDSQYWVKLPKLPLTGATEALVRNSFESSISKMSYGVVFTKIQEVVDFLVGYQKYLISVGFVFDNFDSENSVSQDWITSCKEFMFWTKHNWAIGSLITLSPASQKLQANVEIGIADNLLDSFYDYNVLKADGKPLEPQFLNVERNFENITITPVNTVEALYYVRLYYVLKEHVVVFDGSTVFNDVIYDKVTGYRQGRIKTQGFRTTDWYGDYITPGFIYDNANISVWQPFTDYSLGDIVRYRSYYWVSQVNQVGTENFNSTLWTKELQIPEKQLIPNFDYKINQFEDYYNVTSDGINKDQINVARHAIGYQTRDYLQNLVQDPTTQFLLYQGFIREKGTVNSLNKVFDKLGRFGDNSITVNEEWAFKVGRLGGIDQLSEVEMSISKDLLQIDPQPFVISAVPASSIKSNRFYTISSADFTMAPNPYTVDINPVSYEAEPFRTAGYVNTGHVSFAVKNRLDILNLDINQFFENNNVWVTFDKNSWTVLRYNESPFLIITAVSKVDAVANTVTVTLNHRHSLAVDDIVGIRHITNLSGFFKIASVSTTTFTVDVASGTQDPVYNSSLINNLYVFTVARFKNYDNLDPQQAALLPQGAKIWVDDNGTGHWEVSEKDRQFVVGKELSDYAVPNPLHLGYTVLYDATRSQAYANLPNTGYVISYVETESALEVKQKIVPQPGFETKVLGSFGNALALSPDGYWLAVGTPKASNINSDYAGVYDNTTTYVSGDVVLYNSQIRKALTTIIGTGTNTITNNALWEDATNIVANPDATDLKYLNFTEQGMITLYRYYNDQWNFYQSFVSPLPVEYENFGSAISFGQDGDTYYLSINAVNNTYMYSCSNLETWNILQTIHSITPVSSAAMSRDGSIAVLGYLNDNVAKVYQRNSNTYQLLQTLDRGSVAAHAGDQFGYNVVIDPSATTIVVASPMSDLETQNQGAVYVFKKLNTMYVFDQLLESYEPYPNEFFGESLAISPNTGNILVGAKNSTFKNYHVWTDNTTFDQTLTNFIDDSGYSGAVYVYELRGDQYFLTEKLQTDLTKYESFGSSISCTDSLILVGSPEYRSSTYTVGTTLISTTATTGRIRLFKKDPSLSSWTILAHQEPVVDLSKIKSIALFDTVKEIKIADLDFVDSAKLKILDVAEQEIDFKTLYDPAVYSLGNGEQSVDLTQYWTSDQVGKIWWNLSTAKWLHYEQGEESYRSGNWNIQAPGSTIDVYEWVETILLPSEWSAIADTNDGLSLGVSGQPLYPNDDVYSIRTLYNPTTGLATNTLYYYWVKNKAVIPQNSPRRRISASTVAGLISNPAATGTTFVALMASNQFQTYNLNTILTSNTSLINIEYVVDFEKLNSVHNEYQLLVEGVEDSVPSSKLEAKWIDSLVGYDISGNRVPDPKLDNTQKYGISIRPRQSMFKNRLSAVSIVVDKINSILQKEPFADTINFRHLNLKDDIPSEKLNLYDLKVLTYADLLEVGTTRTKQATLHANVVNGKVETIDIIDPGYGYKPKELFNPEIANVYKGPLITIVGDGIGATAICHIDGQGRVIAVRVLTKGKLYNTATPVARQFAVLVETDETDKNFWGIYAWDDSKQVFYRSQSQSFDTTLYWNLVDWWAEDYDTASRIAVEIPNTAQEYTTKINVGQLLRIKEFGNGGWAVLLKVSDTQLNFLDNYKIVGRQLGTIALTESLYNLSLSGIGYDNAKSFDIVVYDLENSKELRNIFTAIKEDIFIGNYAVEWNKLFFTSIRYVFSEQSFIDWAFKTSFLNVTHDIGPFEQRINYKNDNLSYYQDYINEVKPFRSTVRQFVSRYNTIEPTHSAMTDFDLPPVYSIEDGKVVPTVDTSYVTQYPWKAWTDNLGYSITAIEVVYSGSEYITAPAVVITGTGTGATAQAYISNGKVSGVKLLTPGQGYTVAPTITLVGGNGNGIATAKAVAILGDSKTRTFNITMKFDRLSRNGRFSNFSTVETLTAVGNTASFALQYPPNNNKQSIKIKKNDQTVLNSEYSISLYTANKLLKGKLIFKEIPAKGDVITITYEKNDSLLDSVNRIEKYYAPSSGMIGNELDQLMTGIDFGGVQIQGTTFDVTGGWDALPWFTDNWDSVQSSADFYYRASSSAPNITIPFTPKANDQTNVYVKQVSDEKFTRIDDPFYDTAQQTNADAVMPTPINNSVVSVSITNIGSYTVVPTVTFDNSPLHGNSQYYTATGTVNMSVISAIVDPLHNGNGYAVNDEITINSTIHLKVQSLNTTFRANTTKDSSVLFGVTDFRNLSVGTIITGEHIPVGSFINSINEEAGTIIISSDASNFGTSIIMTYLSATGPIGALTVVSSGTYTSSLLNGSQSITGGLGSGAKATVTYGVSSIEMIRHGSGYITPPDIVFSSGSAAATAIIDNKVITIPQNKITIAVGDTFIFRPADSDGSVFINDPSILDTVVTGGSLATMADAYSTATGMAAEDISIDGGSYISPEQVTATEENIPGQVLDSVSIKVFNNTNSGSTPFHTGVYITNDTDQVYDIGLRVNENSSLLVYLDKVKLNLNDDYTINYRNSTITIITALTAGQVLEIISIGVGGNTLLDYQEFVADGETSLYLTQANYLDTGSLFVTLNGVYTPIGFINSTGVVEGDGKTLIQFGETPDSGTVIKIICLSKISGSVSDGQGVVRVNQQTFTYTNTNQFTLDNFVNSINASAQSSMVVEVEGVALVGPDTIYYVYDGETTVVTLGTDPNQPSGAILISNISVYINNVLQTFIKDYVYDGVSKNLEINSSVSLQKGDIIKIENNFASQYTISNNVLTIDSTLGLVSGDTVKVTWFGEYGSMQIISDEFTGGKSQYQLSHTPLDVSYVWVYKNGIKLTQDQDFSLSLPRSVIYLTANTTVNDEIKIILFGSKIRREPSGFEIYKDMLNVYHFTRYSQNSVVLTKPLNYYDKELVVNDASNLFEPILSKNVPGVVYIHGERIEYLKKEGNVLSQLRRGSAGTPIAELYIIDEEVVDYSPSELLPYNETQDRVDFISDGETTLIGPLDFVPLLGTRKTWYRSTIPADHGPCDQIEIFGAGSRLRKDPLAVYSETLGPESPSADTQIEAEFSVDGSTPYIRLTSALPAGARITIIRKTGKIWYERGENSASAGKTLVNNNTPVAIFIAEKTTSLPE